MRTIKKLLDLLTPPERKRAYLLLGMILVMALLDMIGVASIMPFMAVLANPELVETNAFLNAAYSQLGFTDPQRFLFALGMLVFVLLVISLTFKAFTSYAQLRFTMMREYSIGKRLVEGYLNQPYSWLLSRHSTDLIKITFSEVNQVVNNAIKPMMTLIAQGAVAISLIILLIIINPKLALISGFTLVIAYTLIYQVARGFLAKIGQDRIKANQKRFAALSEALGAFKDVKIGSLESTYIKRFSVSAHDFGIQQASAQIVSQLPRYALEGIAFGGILLVVLYLMNKNGNFAAVLPIVALYAFTGYRLMPALQQIYGAATQLRFIGSSLDSLHSELTSLKTADQSFFDSEKLEFNRAITLNRVHYQYPSGSKQTLKELSLVIPAKSRVGLVGTTGSGKSTIVDLILYLLEPDKGTLQVDDEIITKHNRRLWQSSIGYVPQQIFLTDDTIAANIAFGLDPNDIDQEALERAAKIANIHSFVISDLPQQYETIVGERGVRLSGGQRQRIGIARALYKNPKVLILDEATSALDNLTEQAVMEAVRNLNDRITIIIIAHRLSTVKECDIIFMLDAGELIAKGTFSELLVKNEQFREMATVQ